MTDFGTSLFMTNERDTYQLRQVTVEGDAEIERVNQLLGEGWRLMSIGYQSSATIYVLARTEDRPKHRPGFLTEQ